MIVLWQLETLLVTLEFTLIAVAECSHLPSLEADFVSNFNSQKM